MTGYFEREMISEGEVKGHVMDAVVDTGVVMLMLPQDVMEKLGLSILRKVVATYAGERRDERFLAGPVTIKIDDRFMNTDCRVGPPPSEAWIGQIILEELDLIADCQRQTFGP